MRKITIISFLAALIVLLTGMVTAVGAESSETGYVQGFEELNVRAEPGYQPEQVIGQVESRSAVHITGESGAFYEIEYEGGTRYVSKEFIRKGYLISVNDVEIEFAEEPFNRNNHLLVPFRSVSEALDIQVRWDNDTRQVHAEDGSTSVRFDIDAEASYVNGERIYPGVEPGIVNGHTMIPLRFFAETFDADVSYTHDDRSVDIHRGESAEEDVLSEEELSDQQISGTVDSHTGHLNVRQGPSASTPQTGRLTNGEEVTVEAFDSEWVRINDGSGTQGYVHSHYLHLQHENERMRLLGAPQWDQSPARSVLTMHKIGGTSVSVTEERSDGLRIRTNATDIDVPNAVHAAISEVREWTSGGDTYVDFELEPDYHYVYRESSGSITLTFLPPGLEGKRVVIDAGHGAGDAGAQAGGMLEKDINLDVSLYAQEMLEAAGAEVIMTRTDDYFLELQERAELANREYADLFISVHANAFNGQARGSETFWNASYSSAHSENLAHSIQDAMVSRLGTHYRRVDEANFSVLRNAEMPSILMEIAFMDHPEDAEKLRRDSFRRSAAASIVDGLEEYYHVR
ncbi:N-acetylmuramoyl-L-alanine amidase [Alkalicoccus chagannorensis]|uniref:N-acetylmuramoyl-L-alanine amidase n=1 Tax=Alkalicoccus chagannorensis TaxID=427072 RepID=UPI00042A6C87|nr:N-acetylmuramoyl-L-alanine amidase [Alkalicoccus chagannorensis]